MITTTNVESIIRGKNGIGFSIGPSKVEVIAISGKITTIAADMLDVIGIDKEAILKEAVNKARDIAKSF